MYMYMCSYSVHKKCNHLPSGDTVTSVSTLVLACLCPALESILSMGLICIWRVTLALPHTYTCTPSGLLKVQYEAKYMHMYMYICPYRYMLPSAVWPMAWHAAWSLAPTHRTACSLPRPGEIPT